MIQTLTSIEWKELPTKSGKTSTGYELTFENGKANKVFDLGLKNKPGLKKALKALEKAELPAKVEMHFIEENGFKALNDIFTVDGNSDPQGIKTAAKHNLKSYVSDSDRQSSIERQNALTNASTLVSALLAKGIESKTSDRELPISVMVKDLAKELLKFHTEV